MDVIVIFLAVLVGAALHEQKDNIKHYWDKLLKGLQ